ncbi:MAG TPA: hypothetical protein VG711_12080 [Phycisphaerales bacterium]|nr:hypothetical protein [Phycisphaerales bacterium]
MVSETIQAQPSVQQALLLRSEAIKLLSRLQADKAVVEDRLAQSGKKDAMKAVTGASAIEDAIQAARTMIKQMDELLKAAGKDLHVEESPVEPMEVRTTVTSAQMSSVYVGR